MERPSGWHSAACGSAAAFNLSKLLLMRERPEEARTRFRESVDWNPEFGAGYLDLAKALLDAGELGQAEEAAKTGLAKNPESGRSDCP